MNVPPPMILFFLGMAVFFVICAMRELFFAIYRGLQLKKSQQGNTRDSLIKDHKMHLRDFAIFIFFSVFYVELVVQMKGGRWGDALLFQKHMVFVIISVFLFLVAFFVVTGKRYPRAHTFVVWSFILSFLCMLTTGVMLLITITI